MTADCASCGPSAPQISSESNLMPEWEYLVMDLVPEDLQATLNDLGKKGWSLSATTPKFIFQRPLVEERKPKAHVGFTVGAQE